MCIFVLCLCLSAGSICIDVYVEADADVRDKREGPREGGCIGLWVCTGTAWAVVVLGGE